MLHLVIGRAGSGKTEYVRGVLGELAGTGNDRLLLIVPEQYSFISERAILTQFGEENAQRVEVLSFSRLADYVFRELGGMAGTPADDGTCIILMLRAMQTVKDSLQFYTKHLDNVALAHELLLTVTELYQAKITPEALEAAAAGTGFATLRTKLNDIAQIYRAYDALFGQHFSNSSTVPELLCSKLDGTDFFRGYTIAVDGFKGFTGQELSVLERLMTQADNVYLTLCMPGMHEPDPAMIFASVKDTALKLQKIAAKNNVRVFITDNEKAGIKSGRRFTADSLKFLEEKIFYPIRKDDCFSNDSSAITQFTAKSIYEECSWIAASAKKLMREEGFRCRDIAVIVRNEETYKSELCAAFHRYGIPAFEDSRQPIENQPLIALCKAVLALLSSGFSTENILHYLKTGLSGITLDESDLLENYALLWGIKAKQWTEDFTFNPKGLGFEETDSSKAALEDLNRMRKAVIVPLLKLREECRDTDAEGISRAIYSFLKSTGVPESLKALASEYNDAGFAALAAEQDRIWDILMEVLDKLSMVYGGIHTDIDTYSSLFNAVISVTDIGSIPHGLDEISFGAADRIRPNSPRAVFAAGCAEGVFPAVPSYSGILTQNDRKELHRLEIELALPDDMRASEERFIAYTAVTSASERLYISHHQMEGPGESFIPSQIIDSIDTLFPKHARFDSDTLPADYFAESAASAFSSYASLLPNEDEKARRTAASLREALENSGVYESHIESLDLAAAGKTFEIKNHETATELFGKDMFLSASRVDTYHHCAFEYFCKYGLNAKARRPAVLDSAQAGTVIHYVLENIIRENRKDGLLAMDEAQRKAEVQRWLTIYLNEFMGGGEDKSLRFKYLYNRLSLALCDVVERLCREFSVSDFEPTDFELAIGGKDAEIPCYSLDLPDGGQLQINGSVDRVDTYISHGKTYIRVVDYKSGGKTFCLSDVLYGLNMQMLIYLFAIEAGGEDKYGNVVPAGVLYYPAKRNTVSMSSRSTSDEEISKSKRKDDRGNGLFLSDEETLNAMEHDLEGNFVPVSCDKNGRLKSSAQGTLITLRDMGLLRKKIDNILEEMAVSLHEGHIPAWPADSKEYSKTCENCDFFPVCGFEDGEPHEIKKYKDAEVFAKLEGTDGEEEPDNG